MTKRFLNKNRSESWLRVWKYNNGFLIYFVKTLLIKKTIQCVIQKVYMFLPVRLFRELIDWLFLYTTTQQLNKNKTRKCNERPRATKTLPAILRNYSFFKPLTARLPKTFLVCRSKPEQEQWFQSTYEIPHFQQFPTKFFHKEFSTIRDFFSTL